MYDGEWVVAFPERDPVFRWYWYDYDRGATVVIYHHALYWPWLAAEQALIVLLGGGLVAWAMRRARRAAA
jgi:hypothetical protein